MIFIYDIMNVYALTIMKPYNSPWFLGPLRGSVFFFPDAPRIHNLAKFLQRSGAEGYGFF